MEDALASADQSPEGQQTIDSLTESTSLGRFSPTRTLSSNGSKRHESTQTSLSVSTLNRNTDHVSPSQPTSRPLKAAAANEWPNRLFTTPPPSTHLIMADLPLHHFERPVLHQDLSVWQSPSQPPTLPLPTLPTTFDPTPVNLLLPEMLSPVNDRILEDCLGNIPGYPVTVREELLHLQQRHGELVEAVETSSGEVQYRCRVCGHPSNKPGQRRWDISPHVLTHARIPLRPWKCACGRSYLRSHDRKRHSDKCPIERSRQQTNIVQPLSVPHVNSTLGPQPGMSTPTNRHHPYLQPAGNVRSSVGVGHRSSSDQNPSQGASRGSSTLHSIHTVTSVPPLQNHHYGVIHDPPLPYGHYSHEQYAGNSSALPVSYPMPIGHGYAHAGFTGGPRMGPYESSLQPPDYHDVLPPQANMSPLWPRRTEEVSEKRSMLSMCDASSKDLEASKRTRCMPKKSRADNLRLTATGLILLALCAALYFWHLYSIL